MTTSDARKRNTEKGGLTTRASLIDAARARAFNKALREAARTPELTEETPMPSPIERRHEELRDLLTEIRDRLSEPGRVAVEIEHEVELFTKAFSEAADRLPEPVRAPAEWGCAACGEPEPTWQHECADVTEEPLEVGSLVADVSDDVWWKTYAGCWHRACEPIEDVECSTWAELRSGYAPLRPTTDVDRERVGLPVDLQTANEEVQTANERPGYAGVFWSQPAPAGDPAREHLDAEREADEPCCGGCEDCACGPTRDDALLIESLRVIHLHERARRVHAEAVYADATKERDALRERLDALRADISEYATTVDTSAAMAAARGWLLDRDDERGQS